MTAKNVKLFATYLGPKQSLFRLVFKGGFIDFPYREPVEVDREHAKYLKSLVKPYTDDPQFSISGVSDTVQDSVATG